MRSVLCVTAIGSLCAACSWWRYDDILEHSPVEVLKAPAETSALGMSLAILPSSERTLAFSTAEDGFAIYEFGKTDLASTDMLRQQTCSPASGCWVAESIAPFNLPDAVGGGACVAFGVELDSSGQPRTVLHCSDHQRKSLSLPAPLPSELAALKANVVNPMLLFASGPRFAADLLVAASRSSGSVWFYNRDNDQPLSLIKPPGAGKSYASTLAVAASESARFIAVGEPEVGTVYVSRIDLTVTPPTIQNFCVRGESGFASALAVGHLTTASTLDLALRDDKELVVLPALDTMPFSLSADVPCTALAELSSVRRLACTTLNGSRPCEGLLSTASLAPADLDGDGRDELLVGAPSASVRGNDAAGKVLIASFGQEKPALVGELLASSAESGDRLGSSVLGVPLSGVEVVLAGAPGGNKLAAFFCTSLLPEGKGGARCD
ncbi:MAG TPA: FG-GAP repeat protein [Polyangiaceae bacterium]|nr:FG-GAP repeat protein [Polyangiaceae bacterium]